MSSAIALSMSENHQEIYQNQTTKKSCQKDLGNINIEQNMLFTEKFFHSFEYFKESNLVLVNKDFLLSLVEQKNNFLNSCINKFREPKHISVELKINSLECTSIINNIKELSERKIEHLYKNVGGHNNMVQELCINSNDEKEEKNINEFVTQNDYRKNISIKDMENVEQIKAFKEKKVKSNMNFSPLSMSREGSTLKVDNTTLSHSNELKVSSEIKEYKVKNTINTELLKEILERKDIKIKKFDSIMTDKKKKKNQDIKRKRLKVRGYFANLNQTESFLPCDINDLLENKELKKILVEFKGYSINTKGKLNYQIRNLQILLKKYSKFHHLNSFHSNSNIKISIENVNNIQKEISIKISKEPVKISKTECSKKEENIQDKFQPENELGITQLFPVKRVYRY